MRATLVLVVFALGACSGRSTRSSDSGSDAGDGGTTSGSSGASGVTTGGASAGGASAGGIAGNTTGGVAATGGVSPLGGAAPIGGTSPNGGIGGHSGVAPLGGTAGTAGTAGVGGEGGAAECEGPAPGGCPRSPCPGSQTCMLTSGVCIPSQCDCVNGEWVCTKDCGGGICVDAPSCDTPDPSGCGRDADCATGEICAPNPNDNCIPRLCACSPTGTWTCLEMCTGGVCVRPSCPEGCTAETSGLCGADNITWVCTGPGIPAQEFRDAGCTDPGTQVPRFCCPPTYKPECQ